MDQPNTFFYQPRHATQAAPVDPHEERRSGDVHRRYLFGVLAELDRLLPDAGLQFLLTWELNALDDQFLGCVAVVYDDDQLQRPLWSPAVAIMFKNTGLGRESVRHTVGLAPEIAWRMALRDARNVALAWKRQLRGRRRRGVEPPTYQVPLGASALLDFEPVPFAQRPTDLFFAGSVGSSGTFTVRPRVVARRAMEAALDVIRTTQPDVSIDYRVFAPFGVHFGQDERILQTGDYLEHLTQAKYALCPRGNVEETYRLFEVARAGCVAIGEPLPPRWYFSDCPYVPLRRWSQLPDLLRELRADEHAASEIGAAAERWWRERIAEPQIAAFMRDRITAAGIRPVAAVSAGRR